MRKFALTLVALFAFVGFSVATEVIFQKWDKEKNELTVKDGDKEVTYKVTDKTKVKQGDKDGDLEKLKKNWETRGEKMAGKAKLDITVEKDTITEIKVQERKRDK